jgi:hypothetical protein
MRPDPKTTVLLSYLSFLLSSFSHSAASSFEEQFRNQSFKEQNLDERRFLKPRRPFRESAREPLFNRETPSREGQST